MHIILYGPEGSGKGTQAKLLSEKYHVPIYTSGDLVRETAVKDKTELGDVCRKALTDGTYVPDKEMFQLWENRLKTREAKKGFILDGFPRNIIQAVFLIDKITGYGYGIDKAVYLKLSDEDAVARLSKRHRSLFPGSTVNHDDPVRVRQRLASYRLKEKDLLEFFRKKNLLLAVDASGSVEEVSGRIEEGL